MQNNVTPDTSPEASPHTSGRVLLNSDMGEGLGLHEFGNDEELMRIIDVANVACGYHAGDPDVMERTVALDDFIPATGNGRTLWGLDAAEWCSPRRRWSRSSCTRPGP